MGRPRKKKGRSEKGLGTLTLRGRLWYFRVTLNGKEYTHPTRTDDLERAKLERDRFLRTIRASASYTGPHVTSTSETVTVNELMDDYIDYLRANGNRSVHDYELVFNAQFRKSLDFNRRLASSITTEDLKRHRTRREAEGRKDATINNELAYLRGAFATALTRIPSIQTFELSTKR